MWRNCTTRLNSAHSLEDDEAGKILIEHLEKSKISILSSLKQPAVADEEKGQDHQLVEQVQEIVEKEMMSLIKLVRDNQRRKKAKMNDFTAELMEIARKYGME